MAFALVLGALATLELRDAAELQGFESDFGRSGGYVAVVVPTSDPFSAARCAALAGEPGIAGSGAVFAASLTTSEHAPGVLFQRAAVTPGTLGVWEPGLQRRWGAASGVIVGLALADEFGLAPGSYLLQHGEGPVPVLATLDSSLRNPKVARWAFTLAPPEGAAEECWVEFDRGALESGLGALAAVFTTGDRPAVVRPYFRPDEFTRDPAAEWRARPQETGWAVAGLLVGGLFALAAWFRRGELGLYLAAGTSRGELILMQAAMFGLLLAAALALASTHAFALSEAFHHSTSGAELRVVMRTIGSAALLALPIGPIAAVTLVRGSIADLLKER